MTFAELSRYLQSKLLALGIVESEAQAESELIVASLSKMSLAERMKDSQKNVSPELKEKCEEILARRTRREPIQYCLGETYFYGLRFLLRKGVLIPRADTETLVDVAAKYFSELLSRDSAGGSVALGTARESAAGSATGPAFKPDPAPLLVGEIGCGSGIISIALLKKIPLLNISACDIAPEAIEVSRVNAELNELSTGSAGVPSASGPPPRLQLSCQDWREWIRSFDHSLDALVANPPYIPRSDSAALAPELTQWEPEIALFGGGADGLDFYREFAELAPHAFRTPARVFLEIGIEQANLVADIFCAGNWRVAGLDMDLNNIARVISLIPPNSPF